MDFTKTMEEECKQMQEDMKLVISSLTKEDLKKLFTCNTKEAYGLLYRIIDENERALSNLLGKPFKSEAFDRIKKSIRKFMGIHKYTNIIMNIIGKIIKVMALISLKILKITVNIFFTLLLVVLRSLNKFRELGQSAIDKIKHVCETDEYDDLDTNVSEVIDHLAHDMM